MENYYKILGISQHASDDEIEAAYQTLINAPDLGLGDVDMPYERRKFLIEEAYRHLSDAYRKMEYDANFLTHFPNYQYQPSTSKQTTNGVDEEREAAALREQLKQKRETFAEFKKTAKMSFEAKSWVFIGNWIAIPGAVGLVMFFVYRREGYRRKSIQVCLVTLISLMTFIGLAFLVGLVQALVKHF